MKEEVVERDAVNQALAKQEESMHSHPFPLLGARLIPSAKGNHYKKPVSL